MSIVQVFDDGWHLCHKSFLKLLYKNVYYENSTRDFNFDDFFDINFPFIRTNSSVKKKGRKRKKGKNFTLEVLLIKKVYETWKNIFQHGLTVFISNDEFNENARKKSDAYFKSTSTVPFCSGGNDSSISISVEINDFHYLIPPKCFFYNCDISDIKNKLKGQSFDFLLIDPPWYNRFIKRRKKFYPDHSYSFLDDTQIKAIPIDLLLKSNGLLAIWTTNSAAHVKALAEDIFPTWGVKSISTWFWIKVTRAGELVTDFSTDSSKQPYERLIFASKEDRKLPNPGNNKCIISVPSAIHSHKPPLIEVMKEYLPKRAECLELFARYLLPGWTSVGNQALSMQHLSLYQATSSQNYET